MKSRLAAVMAPGVRDYAWPLAMVGLLLAEIVSLSIAFDTQSLDHVPSIWARFIGASPQYLRLALTVGLTTLLMAGGQRPFRPGGLRATRWLPLLAVHGCALVAFVFGTAVILNGRSAFRDHPAPWALMWLMSGLAAFAAWSLALFPCRVWIAAAWQRRRGVMWGSAIGSVIWASSFVTGQFWKPMSGYTFAVVRWALGFIYPQTVVDVAKLVIGTPRFKVAISPQCSGYEGVGLILAFLTVYLFLVRKDLRFPGALLILPMGAVSIWILNALRIVALIVIGTSGWPAIAKGGFHSQAGWLAFNVVGLGFVAVMNQGRYFRIGPASRPAARTATDATTAYLLPFVVVIATAMITGAMSAGFDWLYPVRVVAAGAAVWVFRKQYANLGWTLSWPAIGIGAATFVIWLALVPPGPGAKDAWPAALGSVPSQWAAGWLLIRTVGYVAIVPLVEELAFRGFLTRRIIQEEFQALPIGVFSWGGFLLSSVVFGVFHGRLWLPGTIAGMLFAAALYRRRSLGDAVQAHATTNGLLALYAFATGHWSVWS